MPTICSSCHHTTDRYTQRRDPSTRTWLITCHVCSTPRHAGASCLNPFSSLRLDHARDEFDRPIEVSSLRQLRQAEQRYKFRSLIANSDEQHFDQPPDTSVPDLFDTMTQDDKWLYPDVARSMVREMRESGDIP